MIFPMVLFSTRHLPNSHLTHKMNRTSPMIADIAINWASGGFELPLIGSWSCFAFLIISPTKESLVGSLARWNTKRDIGKTSGRFNRKFDVFGSHPGVLCAPRIPSMMESNKIYYLFDAEVPVDTEYDQYGYKTISNTEEGSWQPLAFSTVYPVTDRALHITSQGEHQVFRFELSDQTPTNWIMELFGIPHYKTQDYNGDDRWFGFLSFEKSEDDVAQKDGVLMATLLKVNCNGTEHVCKFLSHNCNGAEHICDNY